MRPDIKGLSHGLKKYSWDKETGGLVCIFKKVFDCHLHPYRMHLSIKGLSHGLKKCLCEKRDWGTRLHFCCAKIIVLPPSSRRQATVHRTVATDFRVPPFLEEKTTRWEMYRLSDCGLHPYRMYPTTGGLSHGLKKCPPDTFLHQCAHWCRPFESPGRNQTKNPIRMDGVFVWWRLGDSNPRPHACER